MPINALAEFKADIKASIHFARLWQSHPRHAAVCDSKIFKNQCAMRMGVALDKIGVRPKSAKLKRCTDYNKRRFQSHGAGHIRSAQDLANIFYYKPNAFGLGAKSFNIYNGSISNNMKNLVHKQGMIFIQNGWGTTDHIDLWRGDGKKTGELRGGYPEYFTNGRKIWFWEM